LGNFKTIATAKTYFIHNKFLEIYTEVKMSSIQSDKYNLVYSAFAIAKNATGTLFSPKRTVTYVDNLEYKDIPTEESGKKPKYVTFADNVDNIIYIAYPKEEPTKKFGKNELALKRKELNREKNINIDPLDKDKHWQKIVDRKSSKSIEDEILRTGNLSLAAYRNPFDMEI
jgi:hypothetical protein